MHIEILTENLSGKELLEILVPKIINCQKHTYKIISYRGIGRIPKNLKTKQDVSKRILLEQLSRLLQGYGNTYHKSNYNAVVIVVVDCDRRNCIDFKTELNAVLERCRPKPRAYFRIAVEEMEAWLLGDRKAIQHAYPHFNQQEYENYEQDSIIGTWEKLADITLSPAVSKSFQKKQTSYAEIGKQKSEWARKIGKHIDIQNNISPSFQCFKKILEKLTI
ncbi:MAG: DUF4276 family protein [Planctomycetaceae bacterium]|jgi:hypothetical protein|nr:DUF4276 family protein [Planctomycetaceae bacterium]